MEATEREQFLLNAALHADEALAVASFRSWQSSIELEKAPYAEARLIPAVYARLSRILPPAEIPPKFRGKARATFTQNMILARDTLPYLQSLAERWPVVAIKGLALCARYDAWSKRSMGDFDIYLRLQDLEPVCRRLEQDGWIPKYGMTWKSLVHRTSLRRDSWGVTRGRADLDLHWHIPDNKGERALEKELWATAQSLQVLGHPLLVPNAEMAFFHSLNHGFRQGNRTDALQAAVDSALLLSDCDSQALAEVIARAGMIPEFQRLRAVLVGSGVPVTLDFEAGKTTASLALFRKGAGRLRSIACRIGNRLPSRVPSGRVERQLLNSPRLYRAWEATGRLRLVEMMLLRVFGPMSKPLEQGRLSRAVYDLRDCDVIDEIGGVGWGWPEPEHTCFWSDRADVRLILPASRGVDYLVALSFSTYRPFSPLPSFAVLANGHHLASVNFRETPAIPTYSFFIPKRLVFADWLELSFRPYRYPSEERARRSYGLRRSLPAQRLGFIRVDDQPRERQEIRIPPALQEKIRAGQEPQRSKFERIREKMESSAFKESDQLPAGFDPVFYVLNNLDLFEAEVDPYEHYVNIGKAKHRQWR